MPGERTSHHFRTDWRRSVGSCHHHRRYTVLYGCGYQACWSGQEHTHTMKHIGIIVTVLVVLSTPLGAQLCLRRGDPCAAGTRPKCCYPRVCTDGICNNPFCRAPGESCRYTSSCCYGARCARRDLFLRGICLGPSLCIGTGSRCSRNADCCGPRVCLGDRLLRWGRCSNENKCLPLATRCTRRRQCCSGRCGRPGWFRLKRCLKKK